MAELQFIPNQPIVFESFDQVGLNNDNRVYNQLMQGSDVMAVQLAQTLDNDAIILMEYEYILNPDITGGAADYTLSGSGWSYASNSLVHAPSGTGSVDQLFTSSTGWFKSEVVVSRLDAGTVSLTIDGSIVETYSAVGTYISYHEVAVATGVGLACSSAFDGAVDRISFKALWSDFTYYVDYTLNDSGNLEHTALGQSTLTTYTAPIFSGTYYKVTIGIAGSTGGTVKIYFDTVLVETLSGNGLFEVYSLATASGELSIQSSGDFDGELVTEDFSFASYLTNHTFCILDSAGDIITKQYDSADPDYPVFYDQDRITWLFTMSGLKDGADAGFTPADGCYSIRVDSEQPNEADSVNSIAYLSATEHPKTKYIEAYNDSNGDDGFNWDHFKLFMRLRFFNISPTYPAEGEEYTYSNGTHSRSYSASEKMWEAWVDKVDESTHDAIRVAIRCDHFSMDDIAYFVPVKDYEPQWANNMKRNLASSRFDIQRLTEKLYNKSC